MLKQIFLCAGLIAFPAASALSGDAEPRGTDVRIESDVLATIAAWLSSNYGLPAVDELPAVAFVSSETMVSLRRHHAGSDHWSASEGSIGRDGAPPATTVVAVYDDSSRTIYLPEAWTGSTATEMSVLVHEMVHHLQNAAGLPFACPEEREQLAYAAQQDWLALSGRDLFADFGTDPFTLMARTLRVLNFHHSRHRRMRHATNVR